MPLNRKMLFSASPRHSGEKRKWNRAETLRRRERLQSARGFSRLLVPKLQLGHANLETPASFALLTSADLTATRSRSSQTEVLKQGLGNQRA
ncbi:MAG: hypothetical protein C4519_22915 [Desulfobacteraceae bacterium]|nr:MAG: hypothetical protein C4519_22915 [Desulfobacteraceae bacterium]